VLNYVNQLIETFTILSNWFFKALGYDIQRIDIGIAMCHFEMTLVEAGIKGSWRILKEINVQEIQEAQYTISWIEE